MEVNARLDKARNQIRCIKKSPRGERGFGWDSVISLRDAQRLWEQGTIKSHNIVFQRLVEHDFDVKRTIQYFLDARKKKAEAIIKEKNNVT